MWPNKFVPVISAYAQGDIVIQVDGLRKTFKDRRCGSVEALRGLSLCCNPGEVFGLLGPNGAGKTTTLRIISTALEASSGTGKVMGFCIATQSTQVRANIGVLNAQAGLYGRLTAREVLTYFGRLYRMEKGKIDARIQELSDAFQMNDFLDRACEHLSTGMRQKVNIARTVIHSPPVMLFDEPTAGLDVLAARNIVRFIRQCKQEGRTVLFSSHVMAEIQKLCDKIAVIHEGRLLYNGTTIEIRHKYGDDLDEAFLRLIGEEA